MNPIDALKTEKGELGKEAIMKVTPYNEAFLMIDKVISLDKDKIIAVKNIKPEEPYFKGHFVNFPIMPGALIIEGMGQAATLLVRYNLEKHEEKEILAYKINETKFSLPSFPGDELRYEVVLLGKDDRGALVQAKAFNKDKQVAESRLMLAVVDRKEFREKYKR